jgi:hypothetical protein
MSVPERAAAVEAAFRVKPGLYLIGSLEQGVTVYDQQLRAHNLTWALWERQRRDGPAVGRVAIVGGGVAGLTAASCFLAFDTAVSVTVFEQLWDLCPLQQGADARWLHPRIYDWPADGSRAPGASLPVLNWSEGRASDVARTIVRDFSEYCRAFGTANGRLVVFLGLRHFQINVERNEIAWVATKAMRAGAFFRLGEAQGGSAHFDTIVIAAGFGIEKTTPGYATESYWRNEQLAQPVLDGSQRYYLISGYGDGALVDLCRLTVERFRQDTIVYELFENNLPLIEERLSDLWLKRGHDSNAFEFFIGIEEDLLLQAKRELVDRIRKDTRVTLHMRGKDGNVRSFPQIFGRYSSFLNRLMTFLLYRCGAFSLSFSELGSAVRRAGVPPANVICRHGADTIDHLHALFVDHASIEGRLAEMKLKQEQKPRRLWVPGSFPYHSTREE